MEKSLNKSLVLILLIVLILGGCTISINHGLVPGPCPGVSVLDFDSASKDCRSALANI